MKTTVFARTIGFHVAGFILMLNAASLSAEHPLSQKYLDGLFRSRPHLATFMGDHRFDGALPDLSPGAIARRREELLALRKELSALKPADLDQEIDAAILADGISLELLYLDEIRDWEWDPRLHDSFPYYDPREIVAGRLSDIIHGTFAPQERRLESVASQLRALPAYLAQARAALSGSKRAPAKEYVDQAIRGNRGRIEFFETEVKDFTSKSPQAEAARTVACEALRAYQAFLESDLSKRPGGDWRLGAELYRKKFPLALQTGMTPEEAIVRAQALFRSSKDELLEVARRLHDALWPAEKKLSRPAAGSASSEGPPELDQTATTALIRRVKEEISKDHPRPEGIVEAHARCLDDLRAFLERHDLVGLPPRETLAVEPMPAFKRGSIAAEYLAPGALDRSPQWKAVYYVDPIDPTWPPERVESYLRGQNSYEIQLTAAHEAYPGHHTQYFYSKRNPNPLRAVLWNAAMVEGWAVYGEGLMVAQGWGGPLNDRFRFYDLRGRMIVATNVILDIKLHAGQMSDAEALRLMIEEGFQEKAMAEKKLLRAKLDSTQLAQYFLGYDEIRSLEEEYRHKVGAGWSQRAFNEALIGRGSIAVRFIRRAILGD